MLAQACVHGNYKQGFQKGSAVNTNSTNICPMKWTTCFILVRILPSILQWENAGQKAAQKCRMLFHCAFPLLLHSAPAPGICSHSYRTLLGAGRGEGWGGQRCPHRCEPAHVRRDRDWRWWWGQSPLLLARSQQFLPPSTVQSHQAHSQVSLLALTFCP